MLIYGFRFNIEKGEGYMRALCSASFYMALVLIVFISNSRSGLALELKLKSSINLTESREKVLRPEIHAVSDNDKMRIFLALRKLPTPFLIREYSLAGIQEKQFTLFPKGNDKKGFITDFGSVFVNGSFYFVAQYIVEDSIAGKQDSMQQGGMRSQQGGMRSQQGGMRSQRGGFGMQQGGGRMQQGGGQGMGRGGRRNMSSGQNRLKTEKLEIMKFDKEFNLVKSVLLMEGSLAEKTSLITGGAEVDNLRYESGDDPGVVSDGKTIYVVTEIRKRGQFAEDEPQYRVRAYDLDLNKKMEKDIIAGRFDGGFQKIIHPIYHQGKFWLVGAFVPDGFADPDLPPFLKVGMPEKSNKDIFVMEYDRDWNPVGKGWQLTETFPGIEFFATGFASYKNYFFVTYSYASDLEIRLNRGRIGDGEMYLSVYDNNFKRIRHIQISDKLCSHGHLAIFGKYLLMSYGEKEIPEMSDKTRRSGKFAPERADIIMKVYEIIE